MEFPRDLVTNFNAVDPVRCPCGWARRAFGDLPNAAVSVHRVEIEEDAVTHYHEYHTEVYYFLECGPGARMELNGESIAVQPGMSVYIPPGVRHRARGKMTILNVVSPPFDPSDEVIVADGAHR